jgi:hypothetical protein
MKLKQLLLLTLTALAAHSARAMNKSHIDTEAAAQRAQQIADSLATGQVITPAAPAPQATTNVESKADAAMLSEKLPESTSDLAAKERLLTDEFMHYAASLPIDLPPHTKRSTLNADGHHIGCSVSCYPQSPDKLYIWDMETGKILEETAIDNKQLNDLTLSKHYQVLALANSSTYLQIQDRKTKIITNLLMNKNNNEENPNRIMSIAISKDERYVAAIDWWDQIFIWHRPKEDNSWTLVYKGEDKGKGPQPIITFSHNSQFLIVASRQIIQIIDAQAGKELATFTNDTTIAMEKEICALTVTRDDKYVIVTTEEDNTTVHDIATGKLIQKLSSHGDYVITTSADGKHIITGSFTGTLRVWDFATGKLLRTSQLEERLIALCINHYSSNSPITSFITLSNTDNPTAAIKIHWAPETLLALSLEQLEFMHELIQTRLRVKEQEKPIILSRKQLELFRQLPIFIQKALAINLNLTLDDSSARGVSEAEDIMTMINAQDGSSTANGLQKLIYEYAQ